MLQKWKITEQLLCVMKYQKWGLLKTNLPEKAHVPISKPNPTIVEVTPLFLFITTPFSPSHPTLFSYTNLAFPKLRSYALSTKSAACLCPNLSNASFTSSSMCLLPCICHNSHSSLCPDACRRLVDSLSNL